MRLPTPAAVLAVFAALLLFAAPASALPSLSVAVPDRVFAGERSRDVLIAQVLLDRARHSPGVVDGIEGGNTARAIRAYQRAEGLAVDGEVTPDLLRRLASTHGGDILARHTLTAEDVEGPFVTVPDGMVAQAELDYVGYESAAEKIAEKFHMHEGFLRALNPGVDFSRAGTEILVIAPRSGELSGEVTRIEVDREANEVRAFAEGGALLASYPATVGSDSFPTPSGSMTVRAVAPEATYHFDPSGRDWGPDRRLTIAAGPNNPVGGIWIDLSQDGYGLHGTPDPHLIGKTASHGCVRLTNWDARELSRAVSEGTQVEFL